MCAHFEAGDIGSIWAGLLGHAPSPRVPVAIRKVAVSRIAAVNAAVTSATGVFIAIPVATRIVACCRKICE